MPSLWWMLRQQDGDKKKHLESLVSSFSAGSLVLKFETRLSVKLEK
jgi:hypothetical protein